MSGTKRLLIGVTAPLVVVLGLGGIWAGKGARALKAQIESWSDSLEHSPNPVTMYVAILPLYVDGARVGRVRTVVVQRSEPGGLDSLRIEAEVGEQGLGALSACQFKFDPDAFDHAGPFGLKRALECVAESSELVPFGTIAFTNVGREAPLFLEASQLPCSRQGAEATANCLEFGHDFHRLREDIKRDIAAELEAARIEVRRAGVEIDRAKVEIRTKR